MPTFKPKERRAHYDGIVQGTIEPKADSKFSTEAQIAYAKGRKAELYLNARICAYKNSTPLER